jgi:hypothetical protein
MIGFNAWREPSMLDVLEAAVELTIGWMTTPYPAPRALQI